MTDLMPASVTVGESTQEASDVANITEEVLIVAEAAEEKVEVEVEAEARVEPEIEMEVSAADEAAEEASVRAESAFDGDIRSVGSASVSPPSPSPASAPSSQAPVPSQAFHLHSPCADPEVVMLRAQLKRSEQARRELEDKHLCAICLVEERNCWFVPCGHQVRCFPVFVARFASDRSLKHTPKFNQACRNCADNLPKQLCHICRAPIHAKQAIFSD
jgi:hypothetical protein